MLLFQFYDQMQCENQPIITDQEIPSKSLFRTVPHMVTVPQMAPTAQGMYINLQVYSAIFQHKQWHRC